MRLQELRKKALMGLDKRGLDREDVQEALDVYTDNDSEGTTYRAADLQRVWGVAGALSSSGEDGGFWPGRSARSTITDERLVEALREDVEIVRREMEERAGGDLELPFENYGAAVRWIEEAAPGEGEKLALSYAKPGERAVRAVPVRSGGPLGPLARFASDLAGASGFSEAQVVAFVLADLEPAGIPVTISSPRRHQKLPSGNWIQYEEVQLTIRTADLTFDQLRQLYNRVRERFGVKGEPRLNDRDLAIERAVRRRGGVPDEGKVAFWEEVKDEVGEYGDWRGPYQRWRDKIAPVAGGGR